MEILTEYKEKNLHKQWLTTGIIAQRGCANSIPENFQNMTEQSPEQPDLTFKLALH